MLAGAVPRLDWDTHTIEVSGLVQRPQTFSLDRLIEVLTPQTLPITLVCAGNRRKEQNLVRKTVGFNWGPAAVSTSYWCGMGQALLCTSPSCSSRRVAKKHESPRASQQISQVASHGWHESLRAYRAMRLVRFA